MLCVLGWRVEARQRLGEAHTRTVSGRLVFLGVGRRGLVVLCGRDKGKEGGLVGQGCEEALP